MIVSGFLSWIVVVGILLLVLWQCKSEIRYWKNRSGDYYSLWDQKRNRAVELTNSLQAAEQECDTLRAERDALRQQLARIVSVIADDGDGATLKADGPQKLGGKRVVRSAEYRVLDLGKEGTTFCD